MKAVTLLELLIVVILIGIIAAVGLPGFATMRERSLDNEAKVSLKLIQAAEKIYRMKVGVYWPDAGLADTASLNNELKLDLSESAQASWTYEASSSGGSAPLSAQATRNNNPANWDRDYYIDEDNDEACCCPKSSVCPSQDWCQACPPPPY
ncbi:type II secretion system protein [Candidatus Omnitrophota bacterium]